MINSLFGQFSPDLIGWIPLQILSSFIAVSWLLFIFQTNNFGNRINYLWTIIRFEVIKLLFQSSNEKSASWLPLLSSLFFLIISINLIGILPYGFTSTTHISISYSLAVPLWLSVNIMGFYLSFNSRLSHLVPQGTPAGLIPLMVWIETISLFAQPIALGLRIAANLTAGHLLIFLLSTATWVLSNSITLSFLILIVLILLFLLEIGVACVQAYVFTSLSHFYLDQNI
uniref:ATP synthase subunit a n=1 Tax=Benthodytes marianensis TaxID=2502088 RepID=A0A3T0QAN7_9ECHN|nr:ATP synthase F0 subunit 6 [Benthodytes marianensis]AZZ06731.1 ATP synthase F0 subunit 6 [Benthodytes marianensis]